MHQALWKYFGYSSFIHPQDEIINDILAGRDVLALMPTGGGKSLCYQLPAVLMTGLVLVVSPLIALMKDQVDGLMESGIGAAQINSSMDSDELCQTVSDIIDKRIRILYISPERAILPEFLSFIGQMKLCLIAIDEAHCISEWGHDFRPSYSKLCVLKESFPETPMIALTATAIPEVEKDIVRELQMNHPRIYRASFNRRNLFYQVIEKSDAYKQLLDYLGQHRGDSGIIYCSSRRSAEVLSARLRDDGIKARPYHAGLDTEIRAAVQDGFIREDIEIVVATVAFGMGIDKSNVRFVIHYDLPMSLEAYYQETGRAGRDGQRSDCLLFFCRGDCRKIEYLIKRKEDSIQRIAAERKLEEMVAFCLSRECRRKLLMDYFGEPFTEKNCGLCDNCLGSEGAFDATALATKAMTCITQTGEHFGVNHLSAVLCGSKGRKILQHGHDALPAYGSGQELSQKAWQDVIRDLISHGYLSSDGGPRPAVRLNRRSQSIMCGRERIFLAGQPLNSQDQAFDADLFEALRKLRKSVADSENMPPYIIFHDSSLREMAARTPRSLQDFSTICGVGEAKLLKYGEIFTREIASYCAKHPLRSGSLQGLSIQNQAPQNPAPNNCVSPVNLQMKMTSGGLPIADWFYKHNAWSYSRYQLWRRCRRAYFFNYIAPAMLEPHGPDISMLRRLKSLESCHAIQGKLVHEVIDQQLSRTRLGHKADEEVARAKYTEGLEYYRSGAEEMISEQFNGEVLGESFFEGILEEGLHQIGTFFRTVWPELEGMEYINHEQMELFSLAEVPVAVKLDYACRAEDGTLVICDWKTGEWKAGERKTDGRKINEWKAGDKSHHGELQMGAYALWAVERLGIQPENALCRMIYLASGISKSLRFSRDDLDGIRSNIIRTFGEINLQTSQGRSRPEHFYPDPNHRKCQSCRFSSLCDSSFASNRGIRPAKG